MITELAMVTISPYTEAKSLHHAGRPVQLTRREREKSVDPGRPLARQLSPHIQGQGRSLGPGEPHPHCIKPAGSGGFFQLVLRGGPEADRGKRAGERGEGEEARGGEWKREGSSLGFSSSWPPRVSFSRAEPQPEGEHLPHLLHCSGLRAPAKPLLPSLTPQGHRHTKLPSPQTPGLQRDRSPIPPPRATDRPTPHLTPPPTHTPDLLVLQLPHAFGRDCGAGQFPSTERPPLSQGPCSTTPAAAQANSRNPLGLFPKTRAKGGAGTSKVSLK